MIISLLEQHGQRGPASFVRRRFSYDNSFLVTDPTGAIVLETAGRRWAVERVERGVRGISNLLTIPGFAAEHRDECAHLGGPWRRPAGVHAAGDRTCPPGPRGGTGPVRRTAVSTATAPLRGTRRSPVPCGGRACMPGVCSPRRGPGPGVVGTRPPRHARRSTAALGRPEPQRRAPRCSCRSASPIPCTSAPRRPTWPTAPRCGGDTRTCTAAPWAIRSGSSAGSATSRTDFERRPGPRLGRRQRMRSPWPTSYAERWLTDVHGGRGPDRRPPWLRAAWTHWDRSARRRRAQQPRRDGNPAVSGGDTAGAVDPIGVDTDADVVVVGAGLAGLSAARRLVDGAHRNGGARGA